MEKWKFRIETDQDGPLKLVRPHRQYFGRDPSTISVELEFGEDEPVYACLCADDEGCPGRSVRVEGVPGLVFTAEPGLFGSDADRTAAKKLTFKRIAWGEWNPLNIEEL